MKLVYDPARRLIKISLDGQPVMEHALERLVTAPAQLQIGQNATVPFLTYPEFTGEIEVLERHVGPMPAGKPSWRL